jgi:hypothetical protein
MFSYMNCLTALRGNFVRCGDMPILLAQFTDTPAGLWMMFVFFLVGMIVPLVITSAIAIATILPVSGALKAMPPQYRKMEPSAVWWLLIPLFNLVWTFFVFHNVSRSFQQYFAAQGRKEHSDCGEGIGLRSAICFAVCGACYIMPFLRFIGIPDWVWVIGILYYLAGPVGLVLLIIYLTKMIELKKHITA